jgi:hypothetical protein
MTSVHSWHRPVKLAAGGAVLAALLVMAACGSSTSVGTSPTETPAITPSATAAPTVKGYPIKVFFSKTPESENSAPSKVFAVDRVSPTPQVETFAVQLLIAGPTPEERAAGYYSELNGLFNGTSQCPSLGPVGGPDFTLSLNMKGTTPEQGTATLKFCRVSLSGGIGVDARVNAELSATLLQFPSIKKLVVLNLQSHCFGDMSGQDLCLK